MASFWDQITGATPQQLPTLSGPQQAVSSNLSSYFTGLNPSSFNYSGQLTAPITGGQQQVVNQMGALGNEANQTFANIGQYDPNTINQQFNQDIEQPAMSNWENNVAPYLRESMPAFSSEAGNTLSRAALTEQNNLDQMRMGYQQGQEQIAGNALTQGANFNTANMGIQSVPQEIQQAGLSNSYQAFLNSNQQYQTAVNQMLGYLNVQTSAYTPSNSPLQELSSVAGAGAGIYSGLSNASNMSNVSNAYINALNNQAGGGSSMLPSSALAASGGAQIDPSSSDQMEQAYEAMQLAAMAGG